MVASIALGPLCSGQTPGERGAWKLTVSMSKHRCSLSMSNSPGVMGGSGDGQERGVELASDLDHRTGDISL